MSNGTTPSKKDGSLKNANWVDSAPKEGIEGHDYFVRGTKYTNSNVSAKYGGVMDTGVASNTTTKQNVVNTNNTFTPFSYTNTDKVVTTGSASSADRMQSMIDGLNKSDNTNINISGLNKFKEETKYNISDEESQRVKTANQHIEGQEMKQRSRERSDAQYAKSDVTGEFLKDKHGNRITKKDNDEWEANRDLQSRMNVESGRFPDGSMFNQYGQSAATAQGDAKRRFQGGSPVYSFADDVTKSVTGDLVRRSKLGTWDGGPNVLGAIGKPLSWMGVDEKGVGIGEIAKQMAWHAPGSGEIMDAWELGKDVYKGMKTGSFDDAKLSLGALAAPFASAGDAKKIYKGVNQLLKAPSKLTNITGNVNKFTKGTEGFASQMSKKNPFKIGENLTLSAIDKAGFSDAVSTFKSAKGKYKRTKAQEESIKESSKDNKIAVNKENSGIIKPRG